MICACGEASAVDQTRSEEHVHVATLDLVIQSCSWGEALCNALKRICNEY